MVKSKKLVSAIKFPPIVFFLTLIVGFVSVNGYTAYSEEGGAEAADVDVELSMKYKDRKYSFDPDSVNVKAGQKVRFILVNDGYATHNFVTQEQRKIGGSLGVLIRPGETKTTVQAVPLDAGEKAVITYLCTYHDEMILEAHVER